MSPVESETYILHAESRGPHKPCIPVTRLRAVGWRRIADHADKSVWANGCDLGQDEINGIRVRLAGLGDPDVAGEPFPPPPPNEDDGGRDRTEFRDEGATTPRTGRPDHQRGVGANYAGTRTPAGLRAWAGGLTVPITSCRDRNENSRSGQRARAKTRMRSWAMKEEGTYDSHTEFPAMPQDLLDWMNKFERR